MNKKLFSFIILTVVLFTLLGCARSSNKAVLDDNKIAEIIKDFGLEDIEVIDEKLSMLIPSSFSIMSEEMMKLKYPSEKRPNIIYTNEDGSINIAISYTKDKASSDTLDDMMNAFANMFKKVYASSELHAKGSTMINEKSFNFIKITTPAVDSLIYNSMYITDLNERLLIISFNCIEDHKEDWLDASEAIMQSIKIK